jgi:hypoxanthine phosphoribosyltransferase
LVLGGGRVRIPGIATFFLGGCVDAEHVADDLESVVLTEEQIRARVGALAAALHDDYAGRAPVFVGVLGGAATFTVDLARAYPGQVEFAWMAIKSYSTRNRASGSVRLLKDLDLDIAGRDVIIVDGVIDTGLTMNWLIANLRQRGPASVAVCALMKKPDTPEFADTPTYVGFDVPTGLIVGYGLDYRGHYRNLSCAAVLAPHIYGAVPTR